MGDAPRTEHLTPRAAPQPLTTPHLHPLQMFEQKSDKKLMTTVVLGWRRARRIISFCRFPTQSGHPWSMLSSGSRCGLCMVFDWAN